MTQKSKNYVLYRPCKNAIKNKQMIFWTLKIYEWNCSKIKNYSIQKKFFCYLYFQAIYQVMLLNYITTPSFYFGFQFIFKFYLINYAIKLYLIFNIMQSCTNCQNFGFKIYVNNQ